MNFPRGQILAASVAVVFALGASLAAAGDALTECLAKCDRARLSETNRATCRLDCEQDAATDPELIRRQIAEAQPTPAKPPGGAAPNSAKPPADPAPRRGEACKAECAGDRALSVDDRATCQLQCDLVDEPGGGAAPAGARAPATGGGARPGAVGVAAAATGAPPTGPSLGLAPSSFLTMCLQTCRKGPVAMRATDQATCQLTCENTASVVDMALVATPTGWFTAAPMAASTVTGPGAACGAARAICEGACEKVRGGCEGGCGKQRRETDRETCKLDCGDNLSLCLADCSGAYAGCFNRGRR